VSGPDTAMPRNSQRSRSRDLARPEAGYAGNPGRHSRTASGRHVHHALVAAHEADCGRSSFPLFSRGCRCRANAVLCRAMLVRPGGWSRDIAPDNFHLLGTPRQRTVRRCPATLGITPLTATATSGVDGMAVTGPLSPISTAGCLAGTCATDLKRARGKPGQVCRMATRIRTPVARYAGPTCISTSRPMAGECSLTTSGHPGRSIGARTLRCSMRPESLGQRQRLAPVAHGGTKRAGDLSQRCTSTGCRTACARSGAPRWN
jgi:hypothetical protein